MSELVLLKCDTGSKATVVLCPKCGSISRQILKTAFDSLNLSCELIRPHVCPICDTIYNTCNGQDSDQWFSAQSRYEWNADQYNQSVRENYAQKQIEAVTVNPSHIVSEPIIQSRTTATIQPVPREAAPGPLFGTTAAPVTRQAKGPVRQKKPHMLEAPIEAAPQPEHRREQPAQNPALAPSEDLDKKIERWKRELLDTGKRNKMINYRETKRATLRILEPEATELFNRLALSDKPLTFQKPINKDTDLRTYSIIALMETLSYTLNVQVGDIKTAGTIIEREKTLKNLRSKAKLAQEEQGTNILYLCFGFIYWRAQNRDSSPWFKAPLLMMPVSLGLKSINAPYTLSRYDDEIEVNPTLDFLFNTEYNIDLPKFDLKNKDSFDESL